MQTASSQDIRFNIYILYKGRGTKCSKKWRTSSFLFLSRALFLRALSGLLVLALSMRCLYSQKIADRPSFVRHKGPILLPLSFPFSAAKNALLSGKRARAAVAAKIVSDKHSLSDWLWAIEYDVRKHFSRIFLPRPNHHQKKLVI